MLSVGLKFYKNGVPAELLSHQDSVFSIQLLVMSSLIMGIIEIREITVQKSKV